MIRLIEALNYRSLRYIRQDLEDFHVLVGPNASGKSSFLDVVAFLGQFVTDGLEQAVYERARDFRDLVWAHLFNQFELAVEFEIPEAKRLHLERAGYDRVRYEVAVGGDKANSPLSIVSEKVFFKVSSAPPQFHHQKELFPVEPHPPETIITPKGTKGTKWVVNKVPGGNDNYYAEMGKGWRHSFKLGPQKSALGNLPDDESKFPVATWLREVLMTGVSRLLLNSAAMRRPSPFTPRKVFMTDGSNLPWVIHALSEKDPLAFRAWIEHLRTALPDLETIVTFERLEDRHRYLVVRYRNTVDIPSWMVSDGTLRLFALTLLAYLPFIEGIWLIEEPENGIHPTAVEVVFDSLSSVYNGQVLLATHSPVILSVAEASHVLCFSKTEKGATDIVLGSEHPALRDWKGEENLGVLYAGGVLG